VCVMCMYEIPAVKRQFQKKTATAVAPSHPLLHRFNVANI
jgi:hypothetical protein